MAGHLQSAIVEIRVMYGSFLLLRNINPNQSPACVIECLEKFFGQDDRDHSMFTRGNTRDQIKIMKKLETAYAAYKNLSKTSPNSAPTALVEILDAILTPSNLVKVEAETQPSTSYAQASTAFTQQDDAGDDKSDSDRKIINVKIVKNSNDNNDDDNDEDNGSPSVVDGGAFVQNEEVVDNEAIPSSSFSSRHNPVQRRTVNWVQGEPLTMCGSDQDTNNSDDDMEDASKNTTNAENIEENAMEIASNEDSSSSSDFSSHSNQTEQKNGSEIPVTLENKNVFECTYDGCGKTYGSKYWRLAHEKIHSGIGLFNCEFCGRQYTHRGNLTLHQRTCRDAGAERRRRKRISSRFKCEFCFKAFAGLEGFEKHRRNYPVEGLRKCRFPPCTRKYCYEGLRLQHEKSHSRV